MIGWAIVQLAILNCSDVCRWTVTKDGEPIADSVEPPKPLASWRDSLNATASDRLCQHVIIERRTCENSMCPSGHTGTAWRDIPVDDRGRWCCAIYEYRGQKPHALSISATADRCPEMAALLDDLYGTEPVHERRAREQREQEEQAKQAEAARRQAVADERRRLLATVAENLITPDAASVERMLPALATLLRGVRS